AATHALLEAYNDAWELLGEPASKTVAESPDSSVTVSRLDPNKRAVPRFRASGTDRDRAATAGARIVSDSLASLRARGQRLPRSRPFVHVAPHQHVDTHSAEPSARSRRDSPQDRGSP